MPYAAPVQDCLFSLVDVLDMPSLHAALAPEADLDAATLAALLDAVAAFAQDELAPLNASGDAEGVHWADGQVRAPAGFAPAYRRYVEAGWPRLAQPAHWGGQGLPYSVQMVVSEYLQGANQAWSMYAALNDGTIKTLLAAAREDLLARFLPKLVSGEWTGTMCLTEPQAGSDLGLLRTRAEPVGDPAEGRYRLTGHKIFISSGEHDLAPNIVHLVLARLPGAPAGVRGISLFVVPKFHVGEDGSLQARNAVHCLSVEHKLGLKGSATCALAFDGAEGWLVGQPHRGLAHMFIFINKSRLGVAVQAVAQAQAAFDASAAYARERLQGRATPLPAATPDAPADPLVAHPDIRRMLLTQRAIAEGGRALVHACARWVDLAEGPNPAHRARAQQLLGLLTPIAKAFLSELAFESVDLGLQVFGGHGYTCEWDLAQRLRDVRVTRLYEGTTGIQALDLLARKVLPEPALLQAFGDEVAQWFDAAPGSAPAQAQAPAQAPAHEPAHQPVAGWIAQAREAVAEWQQVTDTLRQRLPQEPALAGAVGVDYLMHAGYVVLGCLWARQARAAARRDTPLAAAKLATAGFYFERLMPRRQLHLALLRAPTAWADSPGAALV